MFQNCVLLRCSLWLFRFQAKSFFPVPAGTRSKTRPRAQGWLLERSKVRAKSMQKLLGHNVAWQGRSLRARFERSAGMALNRQPERGLAVLDSAEMPQNLMKFQVTM